MSIHIYKNISPQRNRNLPLLNNITSQIRTCHLLVGRQLFFNTTFRTNFPFQKGMPVPSPTMAGEMKMKQVLTHWIMEGEFSSFIKAWLSAYLSLTYCYFAGKLLPRGAARLAAFLPVVALFLLLPLQLHSLHLGGTTAFFLAWLANFKLLMFALDKGPLSAPSISLPKFIAIACLPIKLRRENPNSDPQSQIGGKSFLNYAIKAVMLGLILKIYDYEDRIHPGLIMVIYSFHIYFTLEIMLAVAAAMASAFLGAELEPQFNEPYLSTSLQDFWSRRWNLMVTRILRPTVYLPVLDRASGVVGREWAPVPAVMATFVVSGLMHELIFYYLGRVGPTWEITGFFLLHGACLTAEIVVKKALRQRSRWRLPRVVGTVLTVVFVLSTGFWLFFPQLLRCKADERGLAELAAVGDFFGDVGRALNFSVHT